jgi:NitT/TauT family transport system permease protein
MPLLTRLIPIVVVLGAWEIVARAGVVNPNVFPPFSEIAVRLVYVFADGRIWAPLWGTLGLLMGRARWAEWLFEPLFSFGFPLPKIALIPLYVSWFGVFSLSKVMLIFTDCLFPMVLFSYHGARGVSPI